MARLNAIRSLFLPVLLYGAVFLFYSWPSCTHFFTAALTDQGDGLQNLWNLWWVRQAIVKLGQSPWFTSLLHFPYGTPLYGHTLNLFNGLVALPWFAIGKLAQIYNVVLLLTFVATGLATYFLAREVTGSTSGSLLSGFIVTFSEYHFAHAEGHLQLVSFEWVPVFLLFWIRIFLQRSISAVCFSAMSLGLVLLCDYYYFLYAVVAAVVIAPFLWREAGPSSSSEKKRIFALLTVWAFTTAIITSPLLFRVLALSAEGDALQGTHPSIIYSADLLSPFIPGGHWRFAHLTQAFWSRWSGNPHETSVYLGWSVVLLLLFLGFKRQRRIEWMPWLMLMGIFFIFALGPYLHINGRVFHGCPLPYALLERAIPLLRISGCPVRMMSMVILGAAILSAAAFDRLWKGGRALSLLWVVLLVLEYWPRPLPVTRLTVPPYVKALGSLPAGAGVIDTVSSPTWMLYYQTVHQKPLGLGYISRVPQSVRAQDEEVLSLYRHGHLEALCERYKLCYLVAELPAIAEVSLPHAREVFRDANVTVLDLQR